MRPRPGTYPHWRLHLGRARPINAPDRMTAVGTGHGSFLFGRTQRLGMPCSVSLHIQHALASQPASGTAQKDRCWWVCLDPLPDCEIGRCCTKCPVRTRDSVRFYELFFSTSLVETHDIPFRPAQYTKQLVLQNSETNLTTAAFA